MQEGWVENCENETDCIKESGFAKLLSGCLECKKS